jgi:hypothetical protein
VEALDDAIANIEEVVEESTVLTPQFSVNTNVAPKIGASKKREGLIDAPTFGIVRGVYCSEEEELARQEPTTES